MAKAMKRMTFLFAGLIAAAGVFAFKRLTTFVPPARPSTRFPLPISTGVGAAAAAMLTAAPAAHADKVDDAAVSLADAAYPVFQRINWAEAKPFVNYLGNANWDSRNLAIAIQKVLQMGIAASRSDITAAVTAHEKALRAAIGDNRILSPNGLVAPLFETEECFRTIARLITSAGSEKSMEVYNAVNALGTPALYNEFYASVGKEDAAAAYKIFMELAEVGKVSPELLKVSKYVMR